jgi:hypothetical protein
MYRVGVASNGIIFINRENFVSCCIGGTCTQATVDLSSLILF